MDIYIFLEDGSIYFFKSMTFTINNKKWLLKEYKFKKTVRDQEIDKVYMGTDILYFIEQIQGYIGSNLKIEYSKKHLYTEHLFSAHYILVSEIA